jgi:ERCC4-type nuclease
MKLIIDSRESKLIEACQSIAKDIEIITKSLDLGDIIIQNDNEEDKIIIERKTISDLISSISDGRYLLYLVKFDKILSNFYGLLL